MRQVWIEAVAPRGIEGGKRTDEAHIARNPLHLAEDVVSGSECRDCGDVILSLGDRQKSIRAVVEVYVRGSQRCHLPELTGISTVARKGLLYGYRLLSTWLATRR